VDIDPRTRQRTSRNEPEPLRISNVGLFGQMMIYPWKPLGITGSVRLDNNSQWERALTYRAATVLEILDELSVKAMIGTSFVPPAPSQLNAVPLVLDGGVQGNPDLESQTARTYEAAVLARPWRDLKLDLTVFTTEIFDRVENVSVGRLQRAVNLTDSRSRGFEVSSEWRHGWLTLQADVAYQQTTLDDPELSNFRWRLAYGEGAVGGKRPPNFPEVLSHQKVALTLPALHLEVAASGAYVSSRKATVANIALKGESYELEPYFVFGMHVRTLGISLLQDRITEFSVNGRNLLGAQYEHGGTYGVDIPAVGRSVFLRLKQEL
jgi:outer membrane receptor protein involved in Fe transport